MSAKKEPLCTTYIGVGEDETKPEAEAAISQSASEPAAEQKNVLPEQDVFLRYITEKFDLKVNNGEIDLDTILLDPVEIEVQEYKLSGNGTPKISLTAWVKETALGIQGAEITSVIVMITLEWLIEQGFDPYKQWIMPSCSIMRRETGATGQALVRLYGSSMYDFNTDSIEWNVAR